ncbi:MAG TPA: N-acetylmuramoyl-L-alanine amidase [Vicinamibacterales bacterium]|nr:N-acetylmuramoyl-L-alanine amidase [Vicinamibacterales bacterium]
MHMRFCAALVLTATAFAVPVQAADSAKAAYDRALARERVVRNASNDASGAEIRRVAEAFEAVVRRYPRSGYCDNALWQAGNLAILAYQRSGREAYLTDAKEYFDWLEKEYPSSSLAARVDAALESATPKPRPAPPPADPEPKAKAAPEPPATQATDADVAVLRQIRREPLADGVRITLELDHEVPYTQEQLANPDRLFFDLRGVEPVTALQDTTLKFDDQVLGEIRVGRHPHNTTRVAVDLAGVAGYSAYSLYNPYRFVVDFKRAAAGAAPRPEGTSGPSTAPSTAGPSTSDATPAVNRNPKPIPARPAAAVPPAPALPAANSNGKFSIARQLGLSVSRVVIDAGHGGHDPGAHGNGLDEADLTLDVALRVRDLLQKEGVEVVMTRDTDIFIPLEERTAIANRAGADVFLSIHANASRNKAAHGIETYFLNFATNPEAEAVAARENAGSARNMNKLPDIVKAIALNNKINESRDFADMVQRSMVKRLKPRNSALRDLGVKQAPFVVLIGAGMPSVLAEISFVTNKQEGRLLKTSSYRQQIAQSLCDAVVRYQHSLKTLKTAATSSY